MKEHPLYPDVENPVVFALGIIILFGIGIIFCVPLVANLNKTQNEYRQQ